MHRLLIVAALSAVTACAPIEHKQALLEPIGKVQTVPVGGTLASISKQKNLPNVFGAADIYGRKVDTGLIKVIYRGPAQDGGVILMQTDVDIQSNANVFSRMPSTYSASSNTSVQGHASGGHASVSGTSQGSAFAIASHAETNVVLPPNVTEFAVPKGKTLTLATGETIEFIDVQPHQVSYRISAPRR